MSKQVVEYATLPIASLVRDPANARAHNQRNIDAIKGSLAKFGQQRPILVTRGLVVIAGNGTLEAAQQLGWNSLQVRYTDLSGPEAIAYALADNRTAELAEWDMPVLGQQLQSLFDDGFDIGGIGFTAGDWLGSITPNFPSGYEEPKEDQDDEQTDEIDDLEKIKAPQRAILGSRWRLGSHLLVCGDSSNADLVHSAVDAEAAHAIVTDPPYGLSFMGKEWDKGVPSQHLWEVWHSRLKPGAHLLSFSGTRTYHLMTVAIENAGFEIRDMMQWIYGQGFPKSQDISKAIDKAAGAEREVVGQGKGRTGSKAQPNGGSLHSDDNYQWPGEYEITKAATPDAQKWSGWGTALKPANEPICLARKPLSESTIAKNVLKHGTGGLNIDGTRIENNGRCTARERNTAMQGGNFASGASKTDGLLSGGHEGGRFPANVIFDEAAAEVLDQQTGHLHASGNKKKGTATKQSSMFGIGEGGYGQSTDYGDSGGASRFFYVAKPSKAERGKENHHATVKPVSLMQYLVRMVCQPDGLVLEPFAGSGTTLLACEREGFHCVAFELMPEHCDIILERWEKLTGRTAELITE